MLARARSIKIVDKKLVFWPQFIYVLKLKLNNNYIDMKFLVY